MRTRWVPAGETGMDLDLDLDLDPGVVSGFAPAGSAGAHLMKTVYVRPTTRSWIQEEAGEVCGAAEQRQARGRRSRDGEGTSQISRLHWTSYDALIVFLLRSLAANETD